MKVTSVYSVFFAEDIDRIIKFRTEFMDCEIVHHRDMGEFGQYYVLKDAAGNSTDFFTTTKFPAKVGFYGLRINVDDFDEMADKLMKGGYKPLMEPVDTESTSMCVFKAPEGPEIPYNIPNIILFSHKRRLNILSLFH